jgi:hypothetical protein
MVGSPRVSLAFLMLVAALPAAAQSPRDLMFPTASSCYARDYSIAHLASHPMQQVSSISLTPDRAAAADPLLQLWVTVTVRSLPGSRLEALAYCEDNGADTLSCDMEGDAGRFSVTPAKGGAVLVAVSSSGMSFEGDTSFLTLERNQGDDRSFLLQPTRDCR